MDMSLPAATTVIPDLSSVAQSSTMVLTPAKAKQEPARLPVIEIFGPTVQGEGRMVGMPCYFIRLGGCDYRCSWCDSMFAVEPAQVRVNAIHMTPQAILDTLAELPGRPEWIIISGGNPALHRLEPLIRLLHSVGYLVAIETQGSIYKPWFDELDLLTVSPKPPSSGMVTVWETLDKVVGSHTAVDIKVVVFTTADRAYAKTVRRAYPGERMYLSTGTLVGTSTRDDLLDRMRDMTEWVLRDPDMTGVGVGWQLHVGLWGHSRGV
jgi:7-carboxy-7-deazaguanine synthase